MTGRIRGAAAWLSRLARARVRLPGRARARRAATSVSVVAMLMLATAAACNEQEADTRPSVQQRLEESRIWGQAQLRIGVASNEPLMGEIKDGVRGGFDVEIARYLARELGYETDKDIEFVDVHTDDRMEYLIGGRVDMVVASLSYTKERAEHIGFAGPYLVTRQSFLVPKSMEGRLKQLDDFRAEDIKTCSSGSSTTETELDERGFNVSLVEDLQDCVDGILAGDFQAMSSDKTILAGFRSRHSRDLVSVDLPLGAIEQISVGVPKGDTALRDLVAHFLMKSYLAGRKTGVSPWRIAYNSTLGPWYKDPAGVTQPEPQNVPDLVDFDDKVSPT